MKNSDLLKVLKYWHIQEFFYHRLLKKFQTVREEKYIGAILKMQYLVRSIHLFTAEGVIEFYEKLGFGARPPEMSGMRYVF